MGNPSLPPSKCPHDKELTHAAVLRETVEVTHVSMDQVVETSPGIRTEGNLSIFRCSVERRSPTCRVFSLDEAILGLCRNASPAKSMRSDDGF
jgi:hypothetical protein